MGWPMKTVCETFVDEKWDANRRYWRYFESALARPSPVLDFSDTSAWTVKTAPFRKFVCSQPATAGGDRNALQTASNDSRPGQPSAHDNHTRRAVTNSSYSLRAGQSSALNDVTT